MLLSLCLRRRNKIYLFIYLFKLLDRVVRRAGFLAGDVLDCNLAHRRSVAELCMLFKIKSNPMHPLSGSLPLPYVPARIPVVLWLLIGTHSRLFVV